jgi:hypothetical protein
MDQREALYNARKALYQLMPASEARKKASQNISDTCQLELQAAMEYVYKAVEEGKYKCWCYTYLHEQCVHKLQELGYAVADCSTQKDGTLFEIKWDT